MNVAVIDLISWCKITGITKMWVEENSGEIRTYDPATGICNLPGQNWILFDYEKLEPKTKTDSNSSS